MNQVINYGDSDIANILEKCILLVKSGMSKVVIFLLPLVITLIILSLMYEVFVSTLNELEVAEIFSTIIQKILFYFIVCFFLYNWFDGLKLLDKLELLLFRDIPHFLLDFKIRGIPLVTEKSNTLMMNIDNIKESLEQVPDAVVPKYANAIYMILSWVFTNNVGVSLAIVLFKAFLYCLMLLALGEVCQLIFKIHAFFYFSTIGFFFMLFSPMYSITGGPTSLMKSLITATLQYYIVIIAVGMFQGIMLMDGGQFIKIIEIFIGMAIFKQLNNVLISIGTK